ncbi:ABC transporter ATP-binding protein [Sciscionella sediminilitoris]|uniref:ABC transporter ATP-binding protein n=1 Tax=Sciscionella sediminilitoris TaxID=1445613 RepID=UPI0004DF4CA6|nr:ABC transporter ATP-binding protein [Sciscionella sp. SE31]
MTAQDPPLLVVEDLSIAFDTEEGTARAVENVSLRVDSGQVVGLVGESGSGKSVVSAAILGLLPNTARVTGSVRFQGTELLGRTESQLRELRGNEIAVVFQDALSALNPVLKVGDQLAEAIRVHDRSLPKKQLHERVVELLDLVGISAPEQRAGLYPHEFSGGMRQRVLIAMGIANEPRLLIADEPTTALDVTVQAQILEVLERIRDRTSTSILLITHDLGVLAGLADRVVVMYAGSKVEDGPVEPIFYRTAHPYTRGLLASLPRVDRRTDRTSRLYRIPGQLPNPHSRPEGCVFHPRCPHAQAGLCDRERPQPSAVGDGHVAACLRIEEIG